MTIDVHHAPGFALVPTVLDRSEVLTVASSIEVDSSRRSRAGKRHLMRNGVVNRIAQDPRLVEIASRFLGPDLVPFRATLFDKSVQNNWLIVWHQDTALPLRDRRDAPGWGPWSIEDGITYAHAPVEALSRAVRRRTGPPTTCSRKRIVSSAIRSKLMWIAVKSHFTA